jgi:putative ABC transport system ATP-binding protein
MEQSIIKAEHLLREFYSGGQTIQAVKDVSLTVQKGSFTILRGRSGSGKTTLINLISAMDMPTKGSISYFEDDITKMSEDHRDDLRRKSLGIVFQSSGLMSYMSAYENVEFGLRIAGYPAKERRNRAEECLSLVGQLHGLLPTNPMYSLRMSQPLRWIRRCPYRLCIFFGSLSTARGSAW